MSTTREDSMLLEYMSHTGAWTRTRVSVNAALLSTVDNYNCDNWKLY